MITRVIQKKRPRRFALFAIGAGALVGVGLFAALALATVNDSGTCDVTVSNKNQPEVDCALPGGDQAGIVSYIPSSGVNQASGTGLFDPFVRLQNTPTEQGFNTDAPVTFDAKAGTWTHAIKVNAIPVVDCDGSGPGTATCWELFVDINENNTAKRVSLNDVQIWFTNSATTTDGTGTTFTGFASPATLEYHFAGDILINDVNQGSGRGDLRYLVPTAGHTWDSSTYFVLYSKWGTTTGTAGNFGTGGYGSDGGFEEWKVRKTPNVSITKTADAASVDAGTSIGFTITVTNTGVADATGVTISDNLPGGTGPSSVHWTESPDNPNCSISGNDGSQLLSCGPVTLTAGGGSLSVHVSATTTQDNCGLYDNTATFTSTNAGSGSASASITVNCGALLIRKETTKTAGQFVANAGAAFHVTGPGGYDQTVRDNNTGTPAGSVNDEDSTVGLVCVGGLAPGSYTINETAPPTGYGPADGSQADQSLTVLNGTNCSSNLPDAGATATFTNPPLSDIQVNFRDGGSGETSATISCDNPTGTQDTTTTSGWDTSDTETGISAPVIVTCTITIDP